MSRGNGRPSPTPAEELNPDYATTFEPCAFRCSRALRSGLCDRSLGDAGSALPRRGSALPAHPLGSCSPPRRAAADTYDINFNGAATQEQLDFFRRNGFLHLGPAPHRGALVQPARPCTAEPGARARER